MQQDNNTKHTFFCCTKEWLKHNKFRKHLKQADHERKPTNIPELNLFCKEEGAKIPTS